jgi:rhodanese-like protein
MAKERHQEPPPGSSRNTLIILTIGALLVSGLVVWALTRTVETPAMTALDEQPPATGTAPPTGTAPATMEVATAAGAISTSSTEASREQVVTGDRKAVKRIAAEDLREKLKAGNVTVIDVRPATAFATGHIPGSLNIPLASVQSNLDIIPKGREIVTYCT